MESNKNKKEVVIEDYFESEEGYLIILPKDNYPDEIEIRW